MKVLNKKEINVLLDSGAAIRYYDIQGKVYVNVDGENVGAIRFGTYLSLKLAEVHHRTNTYLYREYRRA